QLELLELAIVLLRTRTEVHALQLHDEEFQTLDLGRARIQLRLFRQNQRLERLHIQRVEIGKLRLALAHIATMPHPFESLKHSLKEMFYTATAGALVRIGRRQSMPSNSIDSCARLNDTE